MSHDLPTEPVALPEEISAAARDLARALTPPPDEFEELGSTTLNPAEESDLAFLDVQETVEHYRLQELALSRRDIGIPCVHVPDEDPLPVSIIPPYARARYDRYGDSDVIRDTDIEMQFEFARATTHHHVALHDADAARGFFRNRLSRFLGFRLLGARSAPADGLPPRVRTASSAGSPGLPFTVVTHGRPGLKILYSTAAFKDPYGRQFGETLSTPVEGWLLPGGWIFATRSQDGDPVWEDSVIYDVPGLTSVAQL